MPEDRTTDESIPRGWGRRLRGLGTEPDPRFTLANERTFLAWIRTSLGLVAAGVALRSFLPADLPGAGVRALSVALVVLGTLTAVVALRRWMHVEIAMRTEQPLPYSFLVPALTFFLSVIGLVLIVFLLRG